MAMAVLRQYVLVEWFDAPWGENLHTGLSPGTHHIMLLRFTGVYSCEFPSKVQHAIR